MADPAARLLDFDSALERLLALAGPTPIVTLPVASAAGHHVAHDIAARLDQPPADVSAMDGYALRFEDLPGPLTLVGESAAGRPLARTIGPGEAARIFTGAHVPAGADTVAVQEDAYVEGARVAFPGSGPPHAGAHIRRRGIDFATGAPVARMGDAVTPARLGLLAAAGHGAVEVHRRPRVALLSTGDELVPPGSLPGTGQIVGSNALAVAALLRMHGADVDDLGIAPDQMAAISAAIASAQGHDLLITIGGASVGDHDLVKPALEAAGASLDFWKVAIRPGKPLIAGRLGRQLVVGLPGNPVSAFVCARLFLVPLLRRMAGNRVAHDRPLAARTQLALPANGPRRDFMRAALARTTTGWEVTAAQAQDSSLTSILADADALLIRPEGAPAAEAGDLVPVLQL